MKVLHALGLCQYFLYAILSFLQEDESFSWFKIIGKKSCEIGFLNAGVLFDVCKISNHNEKQAEN